MAHVIKTLAVTPEEHDAITDASTALDMQRSTLIQEGVLEAAHWLGFYADLDVPVRRRPQAWTFTPQRREESASMRFSISISPNTFDLLKRAAEYVGISVPQFAVGATLRYIAIMKKRHPDVAKLEAVSLPPPFDAGS